MKATVISLLPFASEEVKPSLVPPIFHIPACSDMNDPSLTIIGDVKAIEYIPLKGSRFNQLTSIEVAKALVNDKLNSIFGRDPEKNIVPGMAAVDGEYYTLTKAFHEKYPGLIDSLKANQIRWYENLVFLADDDWSKFRQHRMINDLQRFAANALGLVREWSVDLARAKNTACPVCQELISESALKCRHCGEILKPVEYQARIHSIISVHPAKVKE